MSLGPFSTPGLLELETHFNPREVSGMVQLPQLRFTNGLANSYKVTGMSHVMDTSAAVLANRVQEFAENTGPNAIPDIEEGLSNRYWLPTIVQGFMAFDGIGQTGAAAGDCFVGFEIGSLQSNTPFSATPASPCVQVRFHRVTNDCVLYTAPGAGGASASVRCNLAGGFNGILNQAVRVRLTLIPGVKAELLVGDTFDGVVKRAVQTDPAKLPSASFAYTSGFGFILCTGSAAAGCQFSAGNFKIYHLLDGWTRF